MAHQIKMSVNGGKCCTLCGLSEGFEDGCKFSIEKEKIEIENKKIMLGTILISLVFFIFFLFVAVIYFGLDGLKMQISRVFEECRKCGWFAGISHLFRRR